MQAVCVITIEKIKMKESKLKLERDAKVVVLTPIIVGFVLVLLLGSCGTGYHSCAGVDGGQKARHCNR